MLQTADKKYRKYTIIIDTPLFEYRTIVKLIFLFEMFYILISHYN